MAERPIRFLHIADIHLGFRQYNSFERERDFFLSFESAIERYALPLHEGDPPQVDFVIIAGDLFDSRTLQPITLSRTTHVLSLLKEEGIPVFAIEGNHDAARWHRDQEPNWYDYLAGEEMMIYLRDYTRDGQIHLEPWSDEELRGSYYDFNDEIRIVGTHWYGATAHNMLGQLEEALAGLPPKPFNIVMFHGGLTDYVNEMHAGISYEQLLPLREYIQYFALGHVHKRYERQNWVFNPGSLESCKIREYFEEHGLFVIEVGDGEVAESFHHTDYYSRPFISMHMDCDLYKTPEEVEAAVHELVADQGKAQLHKIKATWPEDIDYAAPVCQLEFTGTLGFPFSEIPMKSLEPWIKEQLGAFMLRYINDTTPLDYGQEEDYKERDGRIDRALLEKKIFQALFHLDTRFRPWSDPLSRFATTLKQRLIDDEIAEEELGEIIEKIDELLKTEGKIEEDPEEQEALTQELGALLNETDGQEDITAAPAEESAQTSFLEEGV